MKYLGVLSVLLIAGCSSFAEPTNEGQTAQQRYQQNLAKTVLIHMDLDTLYPDPQLRALAVAAGKGQRQEIQALLDAGVDVNARGTANATALFWAMKNQEGFAALLQAGADPNVIFADGGTVMHWAARRMDDSLLKLALQHGGNANLKAGMFEQPPLFETIKMGIKAGISANLALLVAQGADIDLKAGTGETPVITAASIGRYDIVLWLLNHGAKWWIKADNNNSLTTILAGHQDAFVPTSLSHQYMKKVEQWLIDHPINL